MSVHSLTESYKLRGNEVKTGRVIGVIHPPTFNIVGQLNHCFANFGDGEHSAADPT